MPNRPKDEVRGALPMTSGQAEKIVEAWVSSKEGSEQLIATRDSARDAANEVLSDAQVEPEQLRQAVTL